MLGYNLALFLPLLLPASANDYYAYEDLSFECPATITCPTVCAADLATCPVELQSCPDGLNLCADGTCSAEACDESLETACDPDSCAPFTCRIIVDTYDTCFDSYQSYYDEQVECATDDDSSEEISETSAAFIFFYAWIGAVTVLLYGCCAIYGRCVPAESAMSKPLIEAGRDQSNIEYPWTQASYRTNWIGDFIYFLVVLTLWVFQGLLCVLTILYYQQQELILTEYKLVFTDEIQELKWFENVWMLGFCWTLILKWPSNLRALFYKHCSFDNATHISVYTPSIKNDLMIEKSRFQSFTDGTKWFVNSFFSFVFSDVNYNPNGSYTYCPVQVDATSGDKYFIFRHCRYIFDESEDAFVPGVAIAGKTIGDLRATVEGLTTSSVDEVALRRSKVGENSVPLSKPSLLGSIVETFSHPFYVYQNFMVWTWFPFYYYYMAIIHTIVRGTGGIVTGYFKYRAERNLYELAKASGDVIVLRDGDFKSLPHKDLVPGDVIRVTPGVALCDMAIISSEHILVDESALTGETTPVHKVELEVDASKFEYNEQVHRKNTILAGTTVLETSESDKELAVVTKTGSYTSKGAMLRDILSYERNRFKFDVEVEIVVLILFFYGVFGFAMTLYFLQEDPIYAWFYGMYVFGTALPPLIPTVFVVSVGISDERLSKSNVVSTDPSAILVAGKVDIAFFDKTGTLTEEGLSFHSTTDVDGIENEALTEGSLLDAMSVCHSLTTSQSGTVVGNTLEKAMFKASGAKLNSASQSFSVNLNGNSMNVVKRYTFDHHRMTQSVVIEDLQGKMIAFVKGSIESIAKICNNIPGNYEQFVRESSSRGLYQIAVAMKEVTDSSMERNKIEKDLSFIGFVNFKNELKHDTKSVLNELQEGNVRSIMITGDSTLTGIHIAKECGLIGGDKKVIFGKSISDSGTITWDENGNDFVKLPEAMDKYTIAITGTVFSALVDKESKTFNLETARAFAPYLSVVGRCSPLDKVLVVDFFVKEGNTTLMCGDGGNDCGALKTAHVGLALSDSEASMVSPFTSTDRSISSVTCLLREGRCALASALGSFKYMLMYGQVESMNQIINAYFEITFSEWCWVFMDGLWMVTMAFTIPLSKPSTKLAETFPTSSLFGVHTMSSFIGVLVINFSFTCLALAVLFGQDWFACREWSYTDSDIGNILIIGDNYESETLFLITGFQYIISAVAFSFGFKYRAAWYRNVWFLSFALIWTVLHFVAALVPSSESCIWRINCSNEDVVRGVTSFEKTAINNIFNTTVMPSDYRWYLVVIMICNLICVCGWEYFVVNGILDRAFPEQEKKN